MSFLYLLLCEEFLLFLGGSYLFESVLERATIDNFQFPLLFLVQKLLLIFLASPTQRIHHEIF